MLQRAAGCAYSWWWASHIRTKQGKWLEQSLQEMEEKVKNILLVIEEDADSFAKRAEMYYKKRPELISFVEESYRAYRALAERYNHISKELQTANSTIASVFPEQVQISVEEEDDVGNQPKASSTNPGKAPKTPEIPKLRLPTKHSKEPPIKPKKAQAEKPNLSMSKDEAQEEIDKLQKGILVLQTEKEFVTCSYESGLTKYWEIENQIEEMQDKVCKLQDDYSVSQVIEDNEARALITASVLKTCEDTLLQLQEQQKRSVEEARTEAERVKIAKEKLKSFKDRFLQNPTDDDELPEECKIEDSTDKNLMEESSRLKEEKLELQSLSEKIREYFEANSDSSLTVLELAEKVDELVNKVLSLETAVSSQAALIERLRMETDELQKHLQCLEEEKLSLIDGSKDLNDKLEELEEKFNGIQDLNQSVADESNKLQTHLTEVCCNLDDLSEELQPPKQHDEVETMGAPQLEESVLLDLEPQKQIEKEEEMMVQVDSPSDSMGEMVEQAEMQQIQDQENPIQSGNFQKLQLLDEVKNKQPLEEDNVLNAEGDSPNWRQLFLNGLEDKEKTLLTEYTTILRNYKEMKKRLSEMETRNQESLLEMTAQIAELTSSNAMKDIEIQSLWQKLNILQKSSDEKTDTRVSKSKESLHDRAGNTIDQWKSLFSGLQKKSNMRPLEELLREQSIASPPRMDELRAFASRENSLTEEIVLPLINEQHAASKVEEKFRRDIDGLLEENLEFWLRFSTSFQQIQKFQTAVQGIQTELLKPKNYGKKQEGGTNAVDQVRKSKATSIEKHLREVQMEMSIWVKQNASLKDELKCRFTSLCKVQEEIPRALKEHSEAEKSEFTAHQAAKFQGEVLNMQKENNKVAEELKAGLNHVRSLQFQVEKTLSKLHQNFEQAGSKSHHHSSTWQSTSRTKIPLRSFIFGIKPKKTSLFSCVNPALQKQSSDLRGAGAGPPI